MTKDNIFQAITLILGAVAFVVVGMVVAAFLSRSTSVSDVSPPAISETQQIMDFLALAEQVEVAGLYEEANAQLLESNINYLEESLSRPIQTQEDAKNYMIYWAAKAFNQCVYSDAEEPLQDATRESVDECIRVVRQDIKTVVANMSESEQRVLVESAYSWNSISSITEYYNLFMQNNFVELIQQRASSELSRSNSVDSAL